MKKTYPRWAILLLVTVMPLFGIATIAVEDKVAFPKGGMDVGGFQV